MDNNALFKLTSGLFLLIAKTDKDNGCIINTVLQVTASPVRIVVAVNKKNYTHDMLKQTGIFNVSVLSENAPMEIYKRFGYSSGRDTNKFDGFNNTSRSENGILYLTQYSNAFLSAKITEEKDLGTHTLFTADVTDAEVITEDTSVTYDYYQKNIKTASVQETGGKKGFICTVCGYIYEGNTLPEDFICPVCKHGTEAFKPL
ncbi:MAG: flavin reductase [Lachnospiraceae bacterium]|nr:flavin reductase [Lachnospiraceae bacterium]